MGKFTKIALVLLYAVQLGVVFRDQLVSLYEQAVEMVRREPGIEHVSYHHGESRDDVIVELKRAIQPRYDVVQTVAAAVIPHLAAHAAHTDHTEHPPHSSDDKHKDKSKKQRMPRIREIMYANLYLRDLSMAVPPIGLEPRAREELSRETLPCSSFCAA
jgi:hypothetical protein